MLRFHQRFTSPPGPKVTPEGASTVLSPAELLAPHSDLLRRIRDLVGVPLKHWAALYAPLFDRFASYVQRVPASEAHHHCHLGGLLQHSLEVVLDTLVLRRGALLPPGVSPEELAKVQDVVTYACATAALLHDVGKPAADQRITLFGADQSVLGLWSPLDGPIPTDAQAYRVVFTGTRRYRRHERLAPLLASKLLPPDGLRWIAAEPWVMDRWLAALQGETDDAGPIGALVSKADGLSVARDLTGGARIQLQGAKARPLSERLMTGLKYLLANDQIPLNRRGAGGFFSGDDLWMVSKRLLDDLREHLLQEGQTGVPSRNDRIMDELQQHGMIIPNGERAIWTCVVEIGEWAQQLTLLRFAASNLWSDPDRYPAPLDGTVTPANQELESNPEAGVGARLTDENPTPAPQSLSLPTPYGPLVQEMQSNPGGRAAQDDDEQSGAAVVVFDVNSGNERTSLCVESGYPTKEGSIPEGPGESDLGDQFIGWLRDNIQSARLEINTVNARLHVLEEGLALVSPRIFRDFAGPRWENAQRRFLKKRLHLKCHNGTNIWTCRVAKERKQSTIKVILLTEPETKLQCSLPPANSAVTLLPDIDGSGTGEVAS